MDSDNHNTRSPSSRALSYIVLVNKSARQIVGVIRLSVSRSVFWFYSAAEYVYQLLLERGGSKTSFPQNRDTNVGMAIDSGSISIGSRWVCEPSLAVHSNEENRPKLSEGAYKKVRGRIMATDDRGGKNSWVEWRNHVLIQLESLANSLEASRAEIQVLKQDITALKIKIGIFASAITIVINLVSEYFKFKFSGK